MHKKQQNLGGELSPEDPRAKGLANGAEVGSTKKRQGVNLEQKRTCGKIFG